MVKIEYHNPELESLMSTGKSSTYKELSGKRAFLKAMHGFCSLLRILNSTKDLLMFKQYDYKHRVNISHVLIIGAKIKAKLLFTEFEQGTRISINDLIL